MVCWLGWCWLVAWFDCLVPEFGLVWMLLWCFRLWAVCIACRFGLAGVVFGVYFGYALFRALTAFIVL